VIPIASLDDLIGWLADRAEFRQNLQAIKEYRQLLWGSLTMRSQTAMFLLLSAVLVPRPPRSRPPQRMYKCVDAKGQGLLHAGSAAGVPRAAKKPRS